MRTKALVSKIILFALSFVLLHFSAALQAQEPVKLKEVRVQGNLRVEEDGIRLHLKARPGQLFDPAVVEVDVKSIYRMGFFEDVKAEISPEGVLSYSVKERPYIRELKIQGNAQVSREKIEAALGVQPRTILDRDKVSEGAERVRKLYSDQGYGNARVEYAIGLIENNQAVVQVEISEGSRLLIRKISFEGNRAFSESELKGLMATKEEWFLSFITNRGVLDHDVLTNDTAILSAHYYDHGYINHKIDEPVILRRRDGIELVIRIVEGEQYRVGKVEIGGDLIDNAENLLKKMELTTGQIFRGSRLRNDITALMDYYSDKGFAFAKVEPVSNINSEGKSVDIALVVARGPPVYFNRIVVSGNTKTRDKVVRREIAVAEQELFSAEKIKRSRNALQRTGYFEDVQMTTKKGDQPDAVDLLVDVKEGPTGQFTLGAGYSSGDQFVFSSSISEKNLFGRGQGLNANFDVGSLRQDFVVSFTEPYLYDTPMSLGFDIFNTSRQLTDFESRKTGFGVRTGYPLNRLDLPFLGKSSNGVNGTAGLVADGRSSYLDYMRGGVGYEFVQSKIGNISGSGIVIQDPFKNDKGSSLTSSISPSLSYDSRDHFFNPSEGNNSNLTFKFAGLGGDSRFLKTDFGERWYYSFLKDPNWGGTYTLALGGTLGFGVGFGGGQSSGSDLPLFDRYFAGGMSTVHGFKDRSISPREKRVTCKKVATGGTDIADDCASGFNEHSDFVLVGGDKMAVLNAEIVFPLAEQYGIRGVAFFDMGQAFNSFAFGDFRRSIGAGVRWLSPFGPLRVELGFPINKKPGDETSIIGFSFGNQ